jgi:2-C-methyl-D-erythritol 4-phosphate cytidylyltransferase
MTDTKNIAIILAGGTGNRFGGTTPKQLLKVAGKTIIEHTLDTFESNPNIDEIAVVSNPNYIKEIQQIVEQNHYLKLRKVLNGGKERYHSSISAIKAYEQEQNANLIFHDAVRPLVNHRIISDCIAALKQYNAVSTAINLIDTIVEIENLMIKSIPKRTNFRNIQTPQAFKLKTIRQAYQTAIEDKNFQTTDDCGVVLKYLPKEPVFIVEGEQFNIKLTHKQDLFLIEKFLNGGSFMSI